MKILTFLIAGIILTFSMRNNMDNKVLKPSYYPEYIVEWTEIQLLLDKGLVEDALKKIEGLFSRALKENNHPQIYKTLIYIEKISRQKDELGIAGIIVRMESKLSAIPEPSRSLCYSVLGSLYISNSTSYYNRRNRTNIQGAEQDSADINTWSPDKKIRKANEYIQKSIEFDGLKLALIEDYKPIMLHEFSLDVCPTLYELLLHRAVEHYSDNRTSLVDFEKDVADKILFSDAKDFIKQDVNAHPVLVLYQKWLSHVIHKATEKPFIMANLNRLKYAYNVNPTASRLDLYNEAMHAFYQNNKKLTSSGEIFKVLLSLKLGSTDENKNKYIKIDSLCDFGLKNYKDSLSQQYYNAIKLNIRQVSLEFTQESAIPSGENAKYLLHFRNMNRIYLRVYKLPFKGLEDIIDKDELHTEAILKKYKQIKSWEESWDSPKDFRQHSIELKIDPLDVGKYYIVASDKKNIDESSRKYGNVFMVSNLACFSQGAKESSHIFVVDRNSGEPIKGAKVFFFKQKNRRYDSPPDLQLVDTKITNTEGKVAVQKSQEYIQYYVAKGKDFYYNNSGVNYYGKEAHSSYMINHFFTDRSLYRPGQTVYFKVLSITHNSNGSFPVINKNKSVKVILRNTNYQEVGKLEIKTNEFGSASGSFILPKSGLNGNFQIETQHGGTSIQVDEYKRPSFEVKFDSVKETYKLDELIKISGKAISYNGIPVAGATVKFRVKRENYQFPFYYYRWAFIPRSEEELITSGEIVTNDLGEFSIEFNAIRKKGSDNSSYTFAIESDITDLNQETQSGTTSISLSDKKLFVNFNAKEFMNLEKDSLDIKIVNISGNPISSKVKLVISSLKTPNRNLKERLWPLPDIQKFSEKDFLKYFPNDVYSNEDKIENWQVDKKLFEKEFKSVSHLILSNQDLNLKSGSYKIQIIAEDSNKNTDTIQTYSTAMDSKAQLKHYKPAHFNDNSIVEPGSNINIMHLGNFSSYKVFCFLQSFNTYKYSWLDVNKSNTFSYKVTEVDRGGIQYGGICFLKNRQYEFNSSISVPWTNKNLTIESMSFRDKLLPGQEENWTFKISDKLKSKDKYELLASMYDMSLDQILPHGLNINLDPHYYGGAGLYSGSVGVESWQPFFLENYISYPSIDIVFPVLNVWEIVHSNDYGDMMVLESRMTDAAMGAPEDARASSTPPVKTQANKSKDASSSKDIKLDAEVESIKDLSKSENIPPIRKNLNETVFFYPHLYTDAEGKINIKFTMNEAMTKWKLQMMAHSMDLKYGTKTLEIVTQKPIQIKPFYPRFFRQNDQIQLSASISNLSENLQKGIAELQVLDAATLNEITNEFIIKDQRKEFSVDKDKTIAVQWSLKIPENETRTLLLRYFAKGDNHTDGEENIIPVVSNSKLITETLPLPIKGGQTRTFSFESLKKLGLNGSRPHSFTLEFSSHPVWYAIQVLPFIMEYPHDCSEQLMSRVYANSIGVDVMKRYPKVASTLKRISEEGEPQSKLLQNQELKSALIEETPWVLNAESETEQMKRVALLMDFNNMNASLGSSVQKLEQRQNSDGSFSWFPGSWPDRYMTQHIVVQIAHLKRLGISGEHMSTLQSIALKARGFLDYSIKKDYDELAKRIKEGKAKWEDNHLGSTQLHYYYCKSMYPDWNSDKQMQAIDNFYLMQIENYWLQRGIYDQGMCAIIAARKDKANLAQLITNSLKQRSLYNDELGRYWKNSWSYYWYQLPVETQALMIEVFYEIAKDNNTVDELKTWLMKNKQTQHWGSTKSTSEAIFAILAFGGNYTEESKSVDITLGGSKLDLSKSSAGISYYKNTWHKSDIKSDFSKLSVSNPNKSIAWGAAYYQYFQNLDKVENSTMKELILNKELYIRTNSGNKELLKPITDLSKIKTGDKVTARIIIKCDRPMDYVHLKVMRASGLEPIQQLSGYQYSNGLGYYMSPRDLATDFFISYLPKGTFVLEYDLRASFKGEFSDGITSLQCMYAPEFSAHSKGIRLKIE
ncbi:MAG: hypothetical protein HOP11_14630 [Saprospiraceae bacterium]|nr:hypothetical protein [Saprospiraceae bacterium]